VGDFVRASWGGALLRPYMSELETQRLWRGALKRRLYDGTVDRRTWPFTANG